ncbi:MAG TPA: hypothetical protein VGF13_17200 [Verrucomicrobiae bacterium]|jgi:hypothetical protein
MEFWEITKERAQVTRPVWQQFTPDLKVAKLGFADLDGLIAQFEPLVQAREAAQDDVDEANRAIQRSLQVMKVLGTKVPAIIEGLLDEDAVLMQEVQSLYGATPRTEATILERGRALYPLWLLANTTLAAMVPAQAPIKRMIAGVEYTAQSLKDLLVGYTDLVKALSDRETVLNEKKADLRKLDRSVDQLNKRWYKVAKASTDEGTDLFEALQTIPTEPRTPAPVAIEIATVTQGGADGLQVVVTYEPDGGQHATTKLVQWQVVGTDEGFLHSAPWAVNGNVLGPFAQGAEVKIITEVSNSVGTRTSAPRTMTLGPPIV